jgi:hypothetical protein
MKNLALALVPTFTVWLITLLTLNLPLPLFNLYILYCLSYLALKELRYEGDK